MGRLLRALVAGQLGKELGHTGRAAVEFSSLSSGVVMAACSNIMKLSGGPSRAGVGGTLSPLHLNTHTP